MCQHCCYGYAIGADEAKTEVRCRREYKVLPLSANVSESVPPPFVVPFPFLQDLVQVVIGFIVVLRNWSTILKYFEKRFIAEDLDRCTR